MNNFNFNIPRPSYLSMFARRNIDNINMGNQTDLSDLVPIQAIQNSIDDESSVSGSVNSDNSLINSHANYYDYGRQDRHFDWDKFKKIFMRSLVIVGFAGISLIAFKVRNSCDNNEFFYNTNINAISKNVSDPEFISYGLGSIIATILLSVMIAAKIERSRVYDVLDELRDVFLQTTETESEASTEPVSELSDTEFELYMEENTQSFI